jgi:hypothetical protein
VIHNGRIDWKQQWTDTEIASGRVAEARRRTEYYARRDFERTFLGRIQKFCQQLLSWWDGR